MFKNKSGKIEIIDDEITLGFTTRKSGKSTGKYNSNNMSLAVGDDDQNVLFNRKKLAKEIGIDLSNFVFLNQNHTNNISKISKIDRGSGSVDISSSIQNTDGVYTFENDIVLTSFHADCVPIYFYSKQDNLVGVVHAGWKGTSKNIVKSFLKKLRNEKIDLNNLTIVIGPASGKNDYEVEQDVIDCFKENPVDKFDQACRRKNDKKYILDVKKVNLLQLLEEGIKEKQIYISEEETTANNEKYFSFRQEGVTGRMIAYIVRKKYK
jgi:YfiH family protein